MQKRMQQVRHILRTIYGHSTAKSMRPIELFSDRLLSNPKILIIAEVFDLLDGQQRVTTLSLLFEIYRERLRTYLTKIWL